MGVVDDVMKALDRIPAWKRMQTVGMEVDALAKRVEELEQKLNGKWPADVCRYCGERAARLRNAHPAQANGIVLEMWRCEACGQQDRRSYKAGPA